MTRTAWLAASVLILAPGTVLAQGGGMMMGGGMGGGMGGVGMGGMGMGGMGMGMMGNARWPEVRRTVQVEMEGGRKVEGQVALRGLTVRGDLGTYLIEAGKLRAIRFLKPSATTEAEEPENQPPQPGAGVPQPRGGMMAANGNAPQNQPGPRAKVVLDSGEEVVGEVFFMGQGIRLSVGYGTVLLDTPKLRSITFGPVVKEPAPTASAAERGDSRPGTKGSRPADTAPPDYTRSGPNLIVRSRSGDRIVLYNMEHKQSIEFAGPKDGPLSAQPIWGANVVALAIEGPKVPRIAAADSTGWHVQELREPAAGATPIVGPGIVVYPLGRYVYAYSGSAHRWDVAELPAGPEAVPTLGPDGATIEADGHIFTFGPTGRWEHVDVREVLGAGR